MCGIFAILSNIHNVIQESIKSLMYLENRGYDSSGISFINNNNKIQSIKSVGEVNSLLKVIDSQYNSIKHNNLYEVCIAHTRWATNGIVNIQNTHPIVCKGFAIVHNGILNTYCENRIKEFLSTKGVEYNTDTDTESILLLIKYFYDQGHKLFEALRMVIDFLEGQYAFVFISESEPKKMFIAKNGVPLVLGKINNSNGYVVSSSIDAISRFTEEINILEDGEMLEVSYDGIYINNVKENNLERKYVSLCVQKNYYNYQEVQNINYPYKMQNEMHEQGKCFMDVINNYFMNDKYDYLSKKFIEKKVILVGSGSSFFAANIAKKWLERLACLNIQVELSCELLESANYLDKNTVIVLISQSGETADTLEILYRYRTLCDCIVGLTNTRFSTLANLADIVLYTDAGIEYGVASTKTMFTQLAFFLSLTFNISNMIKNIGVNNFIDYKNALQAVESNVISCLKQFKDLEVIARYITKFSSILVAGRDLLYPVAMEGALKIRELSYIHAEGISFGELKHGTIALVDKDLLNICLVSSDNRNIFEKTVSNIKEIKARGGIIIIITDSKGELLLREQVEHIINVEKFFNLLYNGINHEVKYILFPLYALVICQQLALHTSIIKGNNVDKPRNLAKSVTVL